VDAELKQKIKQFSSFDKDELIENYWQLFIQNKMSLLKKKPS
jgi:hypothetical protein